MTRFFFTLILLFTWNEAAQSTVINMNNKSYEFETETAQLEPEIIKNIRPDLSNTLDNKSLAQRNNNPGNLKYFGSCKFRVFSTMEEGYAALLYDLNLKITGRSFWTDSTTTIEEFINIYAPSFENDVDNYLKIFCAETGLKSTDLLKTQTAEHLVRGIIKLEDSVLYNQLYK